MDGTNVAVSRRHGDNWPARSGEKLDGSSNAFAASEVGTHLVVRALKMAVGAYHGFWDGHIFLNSCKGIIEFSRTAFWRRTGFPQVDNPSKLRSEDIAHMIKAVLEMDDRGFTPELSIFATNPVD